MLLRIRLIICVECLVSLLIAPTRSARAESSPSNEPHLVVIVVIDQLRGDLVTRFSPYFGDDGFRKLMREGAFFANTYFSYGATATAAGHATISTGRIPRQHGIVANKWFLDAATPKSQYAVSDQNCVLVPTRIGKKGVGRSPRQLIGPALGDQIKISDARSRVFSVALKDRSAIFLGGLRPDGVFWWDLGTGRYSSSTYYCQSLPSYVKDFNQNKVSDQFVGKVWRRMLADDAYVRCRPANPSWPSHFAGIGPTFPHLLPTVNDRPGYTFYSALWTTPFGNDLVLDMVRRILSEEKLGLGPAVDMITIGFSSNDMVGHYFGPDSPEVMDMTIQTDRQIAQLLKLLEQHIGLDRCLVVLTGDHGVTLSPQRTQELGLGGGMIDFNVLRKSLEERLRTNLSISVNDETHSKIVLGIEQPWVYLNRAFLKDLGETQKRKLIDRAAAFLRHTDGISEVFTDEELSGPMPDPADQDRYLAWRCYHPQRSGQLYLHMQPYWYKTDNKVSGHTGGFSHDRHVPLFLRGPRIRRGRYYLPAKPSDIAVTIAALLGIEPPLGASGDVLYQAIETHPAE